MPSLNFVLPHWAYWAGLVLFPLLAMILARRTRPGERTYSLALGYMILVTGGILGLHRFYLRNLWGFVFLPIFIFILIANGYERDARSALSDADNLVRVAERTLSRERPRLESAEAEVEELRAAVAEAEEGSFARRSAERRLQRTEDRIVSSRERVERAEASLTEAAPVADEARGSRAFWASAARYAFYGILALMALDAIALPFLIAAAKARSPEEHLTDAEEQIEAMEEEEQKGDERHVSSGWTGWIDRLSLYAGEFVAYWAVIAVFVYYYEVLSRYVFNSPTSWAHESMYLMFGMQYLIAGSYAMLSESHVRVDIFYAPLPRKRKAIVDLFTSIFFFIFAGTLLFTSYIFAMDSIAVPSGNAGVSDWARGQVDFGAALSTFWDDVTNPAIRFGEISFNEWEIPLWPMKFMMVAGGVLLVLQGVSKIAQDVRAVAEGR